MNGDLCLPVCGPCKAGTALSRATNGAESTDGSRILLQNKMQRRNNVAGAISHVELLGTPEADMIEHFGER